MNILLLSYAAFSSFDVLRWFRRNGRLGQTVLDLSPQGSSKLGRISIYIIAMLFALAAWGGSSWQMKYFAPVLFVLLQAVRHYVVHERNEIHQRGLALKGTVIPWGDVQSYFWEPDLRDADLSRYLSRYLSRFSQSGTTYRAGSPSFRPYCCIGRDSRQRELGSRTGKSRQR